MSHVFCFSSINKNYKDINTKIITKPLDPWYLTGFADGESSFTVTFAKNSESKTGYFV